MENGEYKLNMENRMTRLETSVEEIRINHLPHIEMKLNWGIGLVITTLIGVIANFIK